MTERKWEHLICEIGDHKWKREFGLRGRKPRFCPKHKPTHVVQMNSSGNRVTTLHCEAGDHNWEREPTRGRVPTSCPAHKTAPTLVITSAPRNENGKESLHCANGDHDWERVPARGRKPTSCPVHLSGPRHVPVAVVAGTDTGNETPKKKGRPRIHETPEEAKEAQLERSRQRSIALEGALKERGTHLSQQAPYILYKKVDEKPGRGKTPPTITWDKVEEHSPLMMAQYVNKHEADFVAGKYRYEREGKVINIL